MNYAEGLKRLRRGPKNLWYCRHERNRAAYFPTTCAYCGKQCFAKKARHNKGKPHYCDNSCAKRGPGNPRWNGGTSEYPNHGLLKKNRLIKMKETGGRCEVCGKPGNIAAHIDDSKTNHNLKNLIILCNRCHGITCQSGSHSTSKYTRLYGMTGYRIAEITGLTPPAVYHRLRNPATRVKLFLLLAKKRRIPASHALTEQRQADRIA